MTQSSPGSVYRLRNIGLPPIQSIEDFAREIRLSEPFIKYLAFRSEHLYKVYKLSKRSGGAREIAQPSRDLKAVQGWILRNILDKLASSEHSKGFERGGSILENASAHVGSSFILSMDLEDFFPTITGRQVFGIFDSIGYSRAIGHILANLCLYNGRLPQGAPTSPKLANLICARLDARINGYAGPKGIVYTRYADDITLSAQTSKKVSRAKDFLPTIIRGEGFCVNKAKTKISGTMMRKEVTGLVITSDYVGIGRQRLRELRAKIHYLFLDRSNDFAHIRGWLAYVQSVDKRAFVKLSSYIARLRERYPMSEAAAHLSRYGATPLHR